MQRILLVDILAACFGIGAWIAINGLWVELPLIVNKLPENWSLPSYLSVIIQIANIGPISYSIARIFLPNLKHGVVVYCVLFIGCLSTLFLALFWDETSYINGVEHSTALLSLVFLLSLVDCTSSVLFMPYMVVWKSIYLPSYLIGEGLSGLIPALVALAQGVGDTQECHNITAGNDTMLVPEPLEPNFSVTGFFYFLFAMMVVSGTAYTLLENLKWIQKEKVENAAPTCTTPGSSASLVDDYETINSTPMNTSVFFLLLVTQAWASSLTNGVLPSIQTYSCAPYGNETYHLAATLSTLANPIAAFLTLLLPRAKFRVIAVLSVLGSGVACYIMATAALSPEPPLVDNVWGSVIIICAWVIFTGIMSYVRLEIANLMRVEGGKQLFWSGAVTQAGSAAGAVVIFILVNVVKVFTAADPCN